MDWFLKLEKEEQEFIKQFIFASGSLKKLAAMYDVSYPTIRLRLDTVIQKIKILDNNAVSGFENKMMQMVINEKITLDVAKAIIREYKEEKDGRI